MAKANKKSGSSFHDYLAKEGLLEECTITAYKRVIAWQIERILELSGMSKSELAAKMKTSRSSLDRMLNPEEKGLTLETMANAAESLGARLEINFVPLSGKKSFAQSSARS